MLSPDNPSAVALGYSPDHSEVDTAKWPKKATGDSQQRCSSCALYTKQDDTAGSCTIFGSKQVAANGWCNAWTSR